MGCSMAADWTARGHPRAAARPAMVPGRGRQRILPRIRSGICAPSMSPQSVAAAHKGDRQTRPRDDQGTVYRAGCPNLLSDLDLARDAGDTGDSLPVARGRVSYPAGGQIPNGLDRRGCAAYNRLVNTPRKFFE